MPFQFVCANSKRNKKKTFLCTFRHFQIYFLLVSVLFEETWNETEWEWIWQMSGGTDSFERWNCLNECLCWTWANSAFFFIFFSVFFLDFSIFNCFDFDAHFLYKSDVKWNEKWKWWNEWSVASQRKRKRKQMEEKLEKNFAWFKNVWVNAKPKMNERMKEANEWNCEKQQQPQTQNSMKKRWK